MNGWHVLAIIGGTAVVGGGIALLVTSQRRSQDRTAANERARMEAERKRAADELAKQEQKRPTMGPMVDTMLGISNLATGLAGSILGRKDVQDSIAGGISKGIGSAFSSGDPNAPPEATGYEFDSPEMYGG